MSEKKAFVFDTNFIIQNKALNEVIENLSDRFVVYVTQVSIDERIGQRCRELKARFDEVEKIRTSSADIATISIPHTYEEKERLLAQRIQEGYERTFKEHIIPFSKSADMLSAVYTRAINKIPPFLSDDNASDKGFKDALIWESMLSFFKTDGEQEIIFVTDDKGFQKNMKNLCSEFTEQTGKTITIHENSYYKELLKPELAEEAVVTKPEMPKIQLNDIREKIHSVTHELCYTVEYDESWGPYEISTFSISQKVDEEYVAEMFERMEWVYQNNIFTTEFSASQIMDLDGRFSNSTVRITINTIEEALRLKESIEKNTPEYLKQFYAAVAANINLHYIEDNSEQNPSATDDDNLPF